jgi:DNA-binding response OmpR family regulator
MSARILLVEDDPEVAVAQAKYLSNRRYVVECVGSLKEARQRLRATEYSSLVLDRILPDGDGIDLLRELRQPGHAYIPIIVVSALDDEQDIICGLALGADAYIGKPYSATLLWVHVENVLQRQRRDVAKVYIDRDSRLVYGDTRSVPLSKQELAVLDVLSASGATVPRPKVLAGLSPSRQQRVGLGALRLVDEYVCGLRKKLAGAGCGNWVLTIRSRGYRWAGPEIRRESESEIGT